MKNKAKSRMRVKAAVVFFTVLILGIAAGVFFSPIFNVDEVICEGNEKISTDEIIQTAQVNIGKNIMRQGIGGIRKRIMGIAMVESVSVKRILPNRVRIIVQERTPAAYMSFDGRLAVIDIDGRVLEVISDDRVSKITDANTPKTSTDDKKSDGGGDFGNKEERQKNFADSEDDLNSGNEEQTSGNQDKSSDSSAIQDNINPYRVPLVVGAELSKAEPGRIAESGSKEKFSIATEFFGSLNKAGLLERATYIDINDLSDVKLVVENRLEIQLGLLKNMEYRCAFLAKVINEKISSTEHVVMDYRTDDIYVRQPDDGKSRMVPKPSAAPESDLSEESEESEEAPGEADE